MNGKGHQHESIHAQVKQVNLPQFKLRLVRKSICLVNRLTRTNYVKLTGSTGIHSLGQLFGEHVKEYSFPRPPRAAAKASKPACERLLVHGE
jgi:hypothetical protein